MIKITKLITLVPLSFQVDTLSKREPHEGKLNSIFHRSLLSFAARIVTNKFIIDSNNLVDQDVKLYNMKILSNMKCKTIYNNKEYHP